MKIEPVTNSSDPNVLTYNILLNCGYVETARHATVICEHRIGFTSPKEALLHLHKALKAAFNESGWAEPNEKFQKELFSDWLSEWCKSENDGAPGGYECWEVMQAYDWEIPGRLTTGLLVDITEKAEVLLASENEIENHLDAFNGIYIPSHIGDTWPLTSDLRMYVLTVGKVKPKPISKPSKNAI